MIETRFKSYFSLKVWAKAEKIDKRCSYFVVSWSGFFAQAFSHREFIHCSWLIPNLLASDFSSNQAAVFICESCCKGWARFSIGSRRLKSLQLSIPLACWQFCCLLGCDPICSNLAFVVISQFLLVEYKQRIQMQQFDREGCSSVKIFRSSWVRGMAQDSLAYVWSFSPCAVDPESCLVGR